MQDDEYQSVRRMSTQQDGMIGGMITKFNDSSRNVTKEKEDATPLLLPRCYDHDDHDIISCISSSKSSTPGKLWRQDQKYDERKKSNKYREEKKQKEAKINKMETRRETSLVLPPRTRRHVKQNRKIIPLGKEKQDMNHPLSKFLCFVRLECIEVFTATEEDVHERLSSKRVKINQAGIRCRFCARLRDRKGRSSNFPSSIPKIYQGVSMMIYKHFPVCDQMPTEVRSKYDALKKLTKRGNTNSQEYWIQSANDIGLIDTPATGRNVILLQRQMNQEE